MSIQYTGKRELQEIKKGRKMMKKLLLIPLVIILAVSMVLGSCGEPEKTTAPTTTAPTTTAPTTTAPTTTAPTTTAPTTTPPTTTPPTTTAPAPVIDWNDAYDNDGVTATVTGPVVGYEDMGEGIAKYLIYIGDEFSGTIAMILYEDIDGFPSLDDYVGMTVEVTGEIYINQYRSQAEIAVTDPSQIVIVD